jgi:hypothetical protein
MLPSQSRQCGGILKVVSTKTQRPDVISLNGMHSSTLARRPTADGVAGYERSRSLMEWPAMSAAEALRAARAAGIQLSIEGGDLVLNRHRGKGQQRWSMSMSTRAGRLWSASLAPLRSRTGGGDRSKPEEQPHAKQIAHALEPALPSPDEGRDAVPIASDDERALSDARRRLARCAEGQ